MGRKRQTTLRDDHYDGITLRRLPSGRWQVRVRDPRQKAYLARTYDTEQEATAFGEKKKAEFTLGRDNALACTLDTVWKAYKEERLDDGKAAKRTTAAMQRVVDGLTAAGAVDFKAEGFRGAVSHYFRTLELSRSKAADGRVAVSTRRRILSQIRALLNFARTAGWMVADPLAGFSPVGAREQDDTTRETFTVDEARRLVSLHRPDHAVWAHTMLMLYAGLRDAEAQAITWDDYDQDAGLLWVRKGKGNKVRAVPVQPELAAILAEVSRSTGPKAKVACMPSAPIVRQAKGHRITYPKYRNLLKEAGVKHERGTDQITGMPRRLNRHSCRHTFCAAMLATGQPGDALRIVMGHGEADLTALYGAQVATYDKRVRAEGWERGRLHFMAPPTTSSAAKAR